VKANDVPLVTINQISPVYVQFAVPESSLGNIRNQPMRSVVVTARSKNGGAPLTEGVLSFIDNAVDPTTGTITLKATFSNQNRALWPGQFVDLGVRVATRDNVTVVPSSAVLAGQKGTFVWVVRKDQGVENRPVTVSDTVGSDAIVDAGIQPGDVVVTDGQLRLNPRSKVEVKQGS
jgi:multidrug efflux system membrane fusion protein